MLRSLAIRVGTPCDATFLDQAPVAAAVAALMLGAFGCAPPAAPVAQLPTPQVTIVAAIERETVDFDEYTGQAEASETVEVRSRLYGFLRSVEFNEGQNIEEDQTLFTIEPDEYDAVHKQSLARIAVWEAKLNLAQSKLERYKELLPTGAITQDDYEELLAAEAEAQASLGSAKADADRTALDLKYTEIKAPIRGQIDRAYVSRGNLLTGGLASGTLLTRIVNEQPMYVYFDVDEGSLLRYTRNSSQPTDPAALSGDLKALKIPCFAQLGDEKDFPHRGILDFSANQIAAETGTLELRGVFPNEDRIMTSGMFVRVRIPVSRAYAAVMIPEQALATDQSVKYVYVVGDDGKAQRRVVQLGGQRGSWRIVRDGVEPGERVIVKGLTRVRPDQAVEAVESTAELAELEAALGATSVSSPSADDAP